MTCTHLLRTARPTEPPGLAQALMAVEPVTPALFAILAGFGLGRSARARADADRPRAPWVLRHLWRILLLWLLSFGIFFAWSGPQWPEMLTSTGILQCLAQGMALALLLEHPAATLGAGLASLAFGAFLETREIRIDGLNNGSFPLLPWVPLLLLGHAWGRLPSRRIANLALASLAAVVVAIAAIHPGLESLWGPWGMTTTHQTFVRTGAGNGFSLAWDLIRGTPTRLSHPGFWSTRTPLVPVVLALAVLVVAAASLAVRAKPRWVAPLALLGRHSLVYYLGHLAALGGVFLLPSSWRHRSWAWFVIAIAFLALGTLWARWRESRPLKEVPIGLPSAR